MSLALATLIFEWRRYMAAVLALALSGAMVLVMQGLFGGIVHTVFATTERSRADIFIMPVKTATLVQSNPSLPARVKPMVFLNPHVTEVRSFEGGGGMWVNVPEPGQKQVQKFVQIWGVDPIPGAVTLPVDYTEETRVALMEPGSVAVDVSFLKTLGVKLGDQASLNGHTVWVRSILRNYQDVNQTDVVMSRDTMRLIGVGPRNGYIGPLMLRIDDASQAQHVCDQLNAIAHGAYHAWTAAQFNLANERAVLSEQVIGVLLLFLNIMAVVIGIGITSQTLRSAVLSNIREFASLRALGISMGSLRLIIMELSAWAGVAGIGAAGIITWLAAVAAGGAGLPLALRVGPAITACIMMMVIAVISGAMAMGVLKHSQPADLLR